MHQHSVLLVALEEISLEKKSIYPSIFPTSKQDNICFGLRWVFFFFCLFCIKLMTRSNHESLKCMVLFFKIYFSVSFEESSLQRCKSKILVEMVKPFGYRKHICILQLPIPHCVNLILPFPYTSAPARLRLPVPHVSTKSLKSSLSSHAKILFYIWNERIKYCKRYHYEVNRSVLHVNC